MNPVGRTSPFVSGTIASRIMSLHQAPGLRRERLLMPTGYIDIHSHIIPGVDDGSQTSTESREMIERYLDAGFKVVCATSHVPVIPTPEYADQLQSGYEEVRDLGHHMGLTIRDGKEVRLTPEIAVDASHVRTFGLAASRNVLVDFPSGAWPHYAEDTLFQLQTLGLTPILAHPERYGWDARNRDIATGLVDRGALLQITLGSFLGVFGSRPKSTAIGLLKAGLVHFVATDAHGPGIRLRAAIKGIDWLHDEFGESAVDLLLRENPNAIFESGPIRPYVPTGTKRRLTAFNLRRLITR